MRPVVFYHLYPVNNWFPVFRDARQAIIDSGLDEACEMSVLGLVRDQQRDMVVLGEGCKHVTIVMPNEGTEWPTLRRMHAYCQETEPERPILYAHCKGVRHKGHVWQCVKDWTDMMTYFCIERWREAVVMLKDYQAVGCNLNCNITEIVEPETKEYVTTLREPHFAGNFWWARAGTIASLPEPDSPRHNMREIDHYISKNAAERWIGHAGGPTLRDRDGALHSLHQSTLSESGSGVGTHYHQRYPRSRYAEEAALHGDR